MATKFPQQFGPYTLQELIARGGMAEVYRATMPGVGGFEKTVAIKKILPHLAENEEFIGMLVDEARIIVSLNHANIAQVYDLGCLEDTYYIAMEYVHAVDLADVLKELKDRQETVPIPHATYIAGCICAGLHAAHSKTDANGRPLNIVHRDVSPHNVLISFGGDVKIIDFGVAKARGKENHTKAGVIKGKLLYMAPEQAMAKDVDGRADLFAVGLILYRMLTNHLPFEGDNEFQIYNNILSKDIVPPKVFNPAVPEELNQIVMQLLQRDPEKRYQDGYSAKVDLDRCLHALAPGYSVGRLSAWIEDNFTQVAMAKRQRRENPSGRNLPQTPAHFNHTSTGPPSLPNAGMNHGFGTGQHAQLSPAGAGGGTAVSVANGSGSFPQANTSGSYQTQGNGAFTTGQFGSIPTPTGGFQNTAFGSGQFQAISAASQSGMFAAPQQLPPPPVQTTKLPIVPITAILLVLIAIIGMLIMQFQRSEDVVPPVIQAPEVVPTPQTAVQVPEVPEEPDPAPSPEIPEVERITIQITSEPVGAMVSLNGDPLGPTPISLPHDKSKDEVRFDVQLEGYESESYVVVPDVDITHNFELVAKAPEAVKTPVAEKTEKKTAKSPISSKKKTEKARKEEKPRDSFTIPILEDVPAKAKTGKKTKVDKSGKKEEKEEKEKGIINPFE